MAVGLGAAMQNNSNRTRLTGNVGQVEGCEQTLAKNCKTFK